MISTSNSSAGDQLRRAKSTSSAKTTSSGHKRLSTSIDPFLTRQQAETAAVQAYERARINDEPAPRPVPPKLERRRSQKAGRSEGSHFQDARKRSIAREGEGTRAKSSQSRHQRSMSRMRSQDLDGERVITRRRSIIPPATEIRQTQANPSSSMSTTGRHVRRRQSEYSDGSPAPRYSQTITDGHTSLQPAALHGGPSDGYGGNLANMSTFGAPEESFAPQTADFEQVPRGIPTTEHIPVPPISQTNRLKERKSFFGTFQKRRANAVVDNFDNSLPPFNRADHDVAAPIPTNVTTVAGIKVQQRSRNFSDSLKGRLKKVFRKNTKASITLPAQQVESREFHFSIRDTDVSEVDDTASVDFGDPFMTVAAENPKGTPVANLESARSGFSSAQQSDGKSRVTSWANSTVAGVSSIRSNHGPYATTFMPQAIKRVDSHHSLRKASSFFGRPIHSKLQRASKADLGGSEESQGLYAALQKRIRPSQSMDPVHGGASSTLKESVESRTTSALATVPSQRQYSQSMASVRSRAASTVRPVTPQGPVVQKIEVPSPVHEVLSPDVETDVDNTVIHHELDSSQSTPQSALKRRPATKAPPPSQDQLRRRMERSKNRWRSTLDERSAGPYYSNKIATMDDNPYELPSLSRTEPHATPEHDLPHHARVDDGILSVKADALSPSVYSRATDGASPRASTPEDVGLTTITITGREVTKYEISPAKPTRHGPRTGSKEWRRWLSDEMNNWNCDKKDFALPRNTLDSSVAEYAAARCGAGPEPEQVAVGRGSRPSSVSPVM
ncbi:Hypothetical predicted protein [Lecanosticta acicola]|uniref:Uncharacterized protein n=1 Tax=Lecanosticta acicola TaxID=111012 RepID=A0AAI8Z263_9PEZI|nr:Hypothetical predicted protein [Lecanosticta acicola]